MLILNLKIGRMGSSVYSYAEIWYRAEISTSWREMYTFTHI